MLIQMAQVPGDPFRVVAGTAPITDDLDPAVIFSSKYRGAATETFSTSFAVGASEVSGGFIYSRAYPTIPLVLGAIYAPGVDLLYPFGYVYTKQATQTVWEYRTNYFLLEASLTGVTFRCRRDDGTATMNLKIWVIG